MTLFTSQKEKRLWLCVGLILLAILTTLVASNHIIPLITDARFLDLFGRLAFTGIIVTIIGHGIKNKNTKTEWVIWFGVLAVYAIVIIRLGHAERTHLMEYGVLAIFTHKALTERHKHRKLFIPPAIAAILISSSIGVLDELVQLYIPYRVFDTIDILFNFLAALTSITIASVISWTIKKGRKKTTLSQ